MDKDKKMSIDQVKKVAQNILRDVDRICRDNGITYFIFYGTLLGAVRHGGFIPWDDDIDIVMMRSDYNKLIKVMKNDKGRLRLICPEKDDDTIYPHGKIVDKTTELYVKNFRHVEGYGVGIDVFPFDYMSEDENVREKEIKRALNIKRIIEHASRNRFCTAEFSIINVKRFIAFLLTRYVNVKKAVDKLNLINVNNKPTNYVGLSFDVPIMVDKLFPPQELSFEGMSVMAPNDIDYCLKASYGDDYMTPPPVNQRVVKHNYDAFFV